MNLLFTLIVVSFVSVTFGQMKEHWRVQEFPNPIYQVEACGRSADLEKSWICDPNKILKEKDVNDISDILDDIYKTTRCNCQKCIDEKNGYVVMVAIMPRMYRIVNASNSATDVMTDARIYSYYLSLYWSREIADCEQLILVLFSRDDGTLYTMTQEDARKKITDREVAKITLANLKFFDDNDKTKMGQGMKAIINEYRWKIHFNVRLETGL